MVKQHASLILVSIFVIMTACSAIAVGQNWNMVNYDDSMSRHSNQTQIGNRVL